MLNTEHFILLAGHPESWDREMWNRARKGEDLCQVQIQQSHRGRRSAHLVLSKNGWDVRYASGLQGFDVLFHSMENDPKRALEWGSQWAEQYAMLRELFVSQKEVQRAEAKGIDCSCIWQRKADYHDSYYAGKQEDAP